MINVTFIQRRARPTGNYSLESIFDDVRDRLSGAIVSQVHPAPTFSNGLWPRVKIAWSAWKHQGVINHVTGDITFSALAMKREGTILTILDCGDLRQRSDWKSWVLKKIWFQWPVRRVARITTISVAAKSDIVALTGCDPDRIDVIPVAISTKFRRSARVPNFDVPRILQVGTSVNKNLPRLIAALQDIPCTLVIVGAMTSDIRQQLKDTGTDFENHINLSDESLIQEYEKADIVAFASTFEGFGMPIVEAQTVGRPVVTSNISSMPEVAGTGACLVDPFDVQSIRAGFRRIIKDRAYRVEIVNRGFENVRRFDADKIAGQYLQIYQSIAQTTSQKRAA